ncbi:MAG TPA: aminotransferase class I/II-fold pyridoxal phosphate-dependent enzyme, partial [Acidimicrobiia bacterium]|nr:aminotransferase class I/II-fold pyridoxal phosphate-dependent enzyme [Acidimicrobiia bacterium]
MRSGTAARQERLLRYFYRELQEIRAQGLCKIRVEDQKLTGGSLTIEGKAMLNFGSAAYLALNTDHRLKQGAIEAIERFGPVFSSSTAYTSIDLYTRLERQLEQITGGQIIVPTTTTLGHLAALPILVKSDDVALVDAQAHATVHLATELLVAAGIPVETVPHNDVAALEGRVAALSDEHERVWYLADGVYSMFGDIAPVAEIAQLLDRYHNLHLYYDDAHGFGWCGQAGRGVVLETMGWHPRLVVAMSLAKSWGSGGAVLAFPPGSEDFDVIRLCGTTLGFSGPLHPAELGASVAAAGIHLSPEVAERQSRLNAQIDLVRDTLIRLRVPVLNHAQTPLWFVRIGLIEQAMEVARRLMDRGFYLNVAGFPLVPYGYAGLRFTHTLYHTDDQVLSMLEALAETVR